jgi:hypothetical protein
LQHVKPLPEYTYLRECGKPPCHALFVPGYPHAPALSLSLEHNSEKQWRTVVRKYPDGGVETTISRYTKGKSAGLAGNLGAIRAGTERPRRDLSATRTHRPLVRRGPENRRIGQSEPCGGWLDIRISATCGPRRFRARGSMTTTRLKKRCRDSSGTRLGGASSGAGGTSRCRSFILRGMVGTGTCSLVVLDVLRDNCEGCKRTGRATCGNMRGRMGGTVDLYVTIGSGFTRRG